MIIRDELISPYSIVIDQDAFTVSKRVKSYSGPSKGNEVDQGISYHTSLSSAVKRIIELKQGEDSSEVTLKQYIDQYNQVIKQLKDLLATPI